MPIRYKIITRERKSMAVYGTSFEKRYPEDSVVEASPNTLGLMTFKRRRDALGFIKHHPKYHSCIIIRVRGIGRGVKPKEICQSISTLALLYWYKKEPSFHEQNWAAPPSGTVCYKKLRVLE